MTTISPKRKRRNSPALLLYIGLLLGAFILFITVFRNTAANIVWHILEPGIYVSGKTGDAASGFFVQFSSKASLMRENERLRNALATTSVLLLDRNLLYKENQELRARFLRTPATTTVVLAEVLLRPPGTPYDTLIIDVGRQDGVREGNLVSPGGTIIIGRIDEVYDSASRVVLFSSPDEKHDGIIEGATPIPLVVSGHGGGSLQAEVPSGEHVSVGSEVTFPALGGYFSAKVAAVELKEGASFRVLHLTLPVNIYTLTFAEVWLHTALYEQED